MALFGLFPSFLLSFLPFPSVGFPFVFNMSEKKSGGAAPVEAKRQIVAQFVSGEGETAGPQLRSVFPTRNLKMLLGIDKLFLIFGIDADVMLQFAVGCHGGSDAVSAERAAEKCKEDCDHLIQTLLAN